MTREEFLREVRNLNLVWRVTDNYDGEDISGSVLRCNRGDCPILALYRRKIKTFTGSYNGKWSEAARELGMDHDLAYDIVEEADVHGEELFKEIMEAK